METEILHAATSHVGAVQGPWQLAAFFLLLLFVAVLFWLHRSSDSKTLIRKHERDDEQRKQNEEIAEVKKIATGLGKSFDEHIDKQHSNLDKTISKRFDDLDERMKGIETNLIYRKEFADMLDIIHKIDKGIDVINERHRCEDAFSLPKRKRGTQ